MRILNPFVTPIKAILDFPIGVSTKRDGSSSDGLESKRYEFWVGSLPVSNLCGIEGDVGEAEVEIDDVAFASIEGGEDTSLRDAVGDAGAVGLAIAEEIAFEFGVGSFDVILDGDIYGITCWDDIGRISRGGAGEEIPGRVRCRTSRNGAVYAH